MSHVLKFMAAAFVIAAVSLAEAMPLGLRTAMWNISKANRQKETFLETDVMVVGFMGKYDGAAHSVGVTVRDGIEGVSLKYAYGSLGTMSPTSGWSNELPTITDVGSTTVWCEIAAPGYITQTNSATVVILPREVTLTSGSASKVYDGMSLANGNLMVDGDGFVDGEGASYTFTGSQTNVGECENTFGYTLNDNTKSRNYNITTVNGTLMVTAADIGGGAGGEEEPGSDEVPLGGVSKFDTTVMYDGNGHTIDTNTLYGVTLAGSIPTFTYAHTETGPWQSCPFVYTNVCTTSFWYRISADNYQDFIHEARVTITNRPITIASGSGSWFYDGFSHSNPSVEIVGLVDGDIVETKNFAAITEVGNVSNAFEYEFLNGMLASNYAVSCVTGQLSVIAANMNDWVDDSKWSVVLAGNNAKYDGTEKICAISSLSYDGIAISTFTVTSNVAINAGSYMLTITGVGNYSGTQSFEWSILPREVTLMSGSASKVYDGTALVNNMVAIGGDGFVDGEGASYNVTGSQTNVGECENTFGYTLNDNTKSRNYNITTVNGTLTVTAADIGGGAGGDEEPGSDEVPLGGVSKFDTTVMYDGNGHTIDTNALIVALGGAVSGVTEIKYAADNVTDVALGIERPVSGWRIDAPVYTNAGEYVIWYEVTNPNYNTFVHAAKLTIMPRTGVIVDIIGNSATNNFNDAIFSVNGYKVSINDQLYKEDNFEFSGEAFVSGREVGTYYMEITSSQFTNVNENFADVLFRIFNGELVILPPILTPEPEPIKPELGKGDYRVADEELDGTIPESAASVYDGYLYLDNVVMGTIQAKVSKPKINKKLGISTAKTSVAIQIVGEKKLTLKGELVLAIGEFIATDKKSDRTLILKFGLDGIAGTFGKYDIDGVRNFFDSKDKTEKVEAEEILKPYLGAYSMILDGGILSVTIAKKGKVTIKGAIDGNKVSLKAQALIGEDMICIPVIYSKKSVNLAFTIWLPINGGDAVIIGLDDAIIGKAGTLKNGAKFIIDGDIGDAIETEDARTLDLLPDNETITVSGSKWLVADGITPAKVANKKGELTITEGKKGAGIVNPSGLKLSYKSKDGSFKGSFTAYAIVKGKLKKHKATIEGVLVNGIGYGTITIKKIGTWGVTIE